VPLSERAPSSVREYRGPQGRRFCVIGVEAGRRDLVLQIP
jgi:hypothetical protein